MKNLIQLAGRSGQIAIFALFTCWAIQVSGQTDTAKTEKAITPPTPKTLNKEMELSDAPTINTDEEEPSPDDFIMVTQEPSPLNMEEVSRLIGYPKAASKKNIQGQVVIRVLIDKEGNYKRHTVVRKAHPLLQNAVEAHITKLKFSPAIQGDEPIMFWVNIPLNFKL